MNKLLIRLNHFYKQIVHNKMQYFLLISGVGVSIFLLTAALLFIESYQKTALEEIYHQPAEACYLETEALSGDAVGTFLNIGNPVAFSIPDGMVSMTSHGQAKEGELLLSAYALGVSTDSEVVLQKGSYGLRMTDAVLTEGRFITENDNKQQNKVMVIDEVLAKLLYGKESAVGHFVSLGNETDVEIVGVLKTNYYTDLNIAEIREQLDGSEENKKIIAYGNLYCPSFLVSQIYGYDASQVDILWPDKTQVHKIEAAIKMYENWNLSEVISVDSMAKDIQTALKPYLMIAYTVVFCLLLISGVSSMSIMVTAVRRRSSEIGIRKAFGAGVGDILKQFLLEGVLISFISGVIAVILAIFAASEGCRYFGKSILINFHFDVRIIGISLLIGILQGILFSFPPSLVAARTKVSETIRKHG